MERAASRKLQVIEEVRNGVAAPVSWEEAAVAWYDDDMRNICSRLIEHWYPNRARPFLVFSLRHRIIWFARRPVRGQARPLFGMHGGFKSAPLTLHTLHVLR